MKAKFNLYELDNYENSFKISNDLKILLILLWRKGS